MGNLNLSPTNSKPMDCEDAPPTSTSDGASSEPLILDSILVASTTDASSPIQDATPSGIDTDDELGVNMPSEGPIQDKSSPLRKDDVDADDDLSAAGTGSANSSTLTSGSSAGILLDYDADDDLSGGGAASPSTASADRSRDTVFDEDVHEDLPEVVAASPLIASADSSHDIVIYEDANEDLPGVGGASSSTPRVGSSYDILLDMDADDDSSEPEVCVASSTTPNTETTHDRLFDEDQYDDLSAAGAVSSSTPSAETESSYNSLLDEDVDEDLSEAGAASSSCATADSSSHIRAGVALADLITQMEGVTPTIPDAVTNHYLDSVGFESSDPRLSRLLAVAAEKFISGIISDAFENRQLQLNASTAKKVRRDASTMKMEDLVPALAKRGIVIKKPPYHK